MKIFKISKRGMHQKRLGTTGLIAVFSALQSFRQAFLSTKSLKHISKAV